MVVLVMVTVTVMVMVDLVMVMVMVDLVSVTQVQTPHRDCFRADFLFKNKEGSTTNKKLNYWFLSLKHI